MVGYKENSWKGDINRIVVKELIEELTCIRIR